jgi:hypothetical protein
MIDDYEHKYEIYVHKSRRLQELEKQAAQLGVSTPPEIRVEIAILKAETEAESAILQSRINQEVAAKLGEVGRYQSLEHSIRLLEEKVTEQLSRMQEYLSTEIAKINNRYAKRTRQWLIAIGITIIIVVVVLLLAAAFYIGTKVG